MKKKIYKPGSNKKIDGFLKTIESGKDNIMTYLFLGREYSQNGYYEDAIKIYLRGVKKDEDFSCYPLYAYLKELYLKLKDYANAEKWQAVERQCIESENEINYNNGLTHYESGNYKKAAEILRKVVDRNEFNWESWDLLIETYKKLNNQKKLLETVKERDYIRLELDKDKQQFMYLKEILDGVDNADDED